MLHCRWRAFLSPSGRDPESAHVVQVTDRVVSRDGVRVLRLVGSPRGPGAPAESLLLIPTAWDLTLAENSSACTVPWTTPLSPPHHLTSYSSSDFWASSLWLSAKELSLSMALGTVRCLRDTARVSPVPRPRILCVRRQGEKALSNGHAQTVTGNQGSAFPHPWLIFPRGRTWGMSDEN